MTEITRSIRDGERFRLETATLDELIADQPRTEWVINKLTRRAEDELQRRHGVGLTDYELSIHETEGSFSATFTASIDGQTWTYRTGMSA